ncbi:LOW QUALITY PROTEIN: glucose dehydrogenase [FAD, quinone]-like [Homalodisca vitripennis]|uniref:LOW QUALITY PROTEIN: glucose dehydrogenase [FAD, quinone]-like n=1 Tax=Homalodisca vitripennis TaxID=197043 RepID=UPI001EEA7029|nr:LOW QUALITY PROTEIN: glucose dehydrogenase [FAD, quinone]-like [Homalodisca vitripennis]
MMYTRGHKQLFDDWAAAGNAGWSYKEVLPYFIRAENNKNPELVEKEYHGYQGPLTVQRFSHKPAFVDTILAAAAELGYHQTDLNGHNQTGFAVAQMMVDGGLRASTARMYVRANKKRKNLVVKINSQVTRIVIDPMAKRAKAVEFIDSTGRRQTVIAKREIILSAGAVGSPHLLLLSGVGPKAVLKKFQIPVVQNLPVGQNLHNHVATGLRFSIDDDDRRTLTMNALQRFLDNREGPLASTGITQVTGFIQSKYAAGDMPDIQVFFDGFSAGCSETGKDEECSNGKVATTCGKRHINIRPTNILARSKGHLTLKSKDPLEAPAIYPNYLTEEIDVKVLIEGLKFILRLVETSALKKWGIEMDRTPAAGCGHLDFASDRYWECIIREHTGPENHPAGSCRMGPVGDSQAVVDPELRVHGVTNLRVVDASVFPLVPNANPVAGIIMTAEKGADMIRAAWSAPGAGKKGA